MDPTPGSETCEHRYITAYPGSGGWVCSKCKEPILSIVLPIPVSLAARALAATLTKEQPK